MALTVHYARPTLGRYYIIALILAVLALGVTCGGLISPDWVIFDYTNDIGAEFAKDRIGPLRNCYSFIDLHHTYCKT